MGILDRLNNWPRGAGRYHEYALARLASLRAPVGYTPWGQVVPNESNPTVAGSGVYEHRCVLPPGSMLWSMAGKSEQVEGFTVQILDEATGRTLFTSPLDWDLITGQGYPPGINDYWGNPVSIFQPLYLIAPPKIIQPPGLLRVQIKNLSASANALQLLLNVAIPPGASGGVTAAASAAANAGIDPMDLPATPVVIDYTGVGSYTTIPGVVGARIAIFELDLQSDSSCDVDLTDGTNKLRGSLMFRPALGFGRIPFRAEDPLWVLPYGAPLTIVIGAGGNRLTGDCQYRLLSYWGA